MSYYYGDDLDLGDRQEADEMQAQADANANRGARLIAERQAAVDRRVDELETADLHRTSQADLEAERDRVNLVIAQHATTGVDLTYWLLRRAALARLLLATNTLGA